nr:bifunctional riboflavin kinase/FAD synthetase [Ktedonobacteraceae bacterium]
AIAVYAIPLEEIKRSRISSTRIRALVGEGEIIEASDLLGHPVTASGIVVHGNHRGRQIGFPTANLVPDAHKLLPADGVYAARVYVEQDLAASDSSSSSRVYNSAVNIGVRPTFQGHTRLVEAYLLDVDLDLYEKRITLDFIERLRDEQRFSSIEALKAQLTHDVQQARQILQ